MALNIQPVMPSGEYFGQLMKNMQDEKYKQQLLNSPIGDVRNAIYVENLRNQFGEDDPRYKQAKAAFEMGMNAKQNLMDYRNQLSELAPYRATSALGKSLAERSGHGALDLGQRSSMGNNGQIPQYGEQGANVDQGSLPYQPEPQGQGGRTAAEKLLYDKDLMKKTSDPQARQKLLNVLNIEKTLDNINPDDLVQFSGPKGHLRLGAEIFNDAMGKPSPQYKKYHNSLTATEMLTGQTRQFYGDSIQPAAMDRIKQMTHPSTLLKSPEIAKQNFIQLRKILGQEMQTYKDAVRGGISYVPASLDFVGDKFVSSNANKDEIPGENDDAATLSKQVIAEFPNATPENLVHTANQEGLTVQEVINQLRAKGKGK